MPKAKTKPTDAPLSFRLSDDQRARLEREAKAAGLDVGAYVRLRLFGEGTIEATIERMGAELDALKRAMRGS